MASTLKSETSYLVSTDIGIMQVKMKTVTGYDVEDIVADKARSQARAVQMANIGKAVDPTKPLGARTLPSIWLNNEVKLGS